MFQVDDEYLNGYARLCGPIATLVYLSLCRHANKEQTSWPSIERISEELAINKRSVLRGVKSLVEWGIILVEKRKDTKTKRQKVNKYLLVDKQYWKQKPGVPESPGKGESRVTIKTEPGDYNDQKPGDSSALEGNTYITDVIEGNTLKDIATTSVADEVNEIMGRFHDTINPTINFGNTTQRKAAADLVKKIGLEKTLRAVDYAASVQGTPYAPTITNPYQLKERFAALMAFYKKNEAKSPLVVVI